MRNINRYIPDGKKYFLASKVGKDLLGYSLIQIYNFYIINIEPIITTKSFTLSFDQLINNIINYTNYIVKVLKIRKGFGYIYF